VRRLRLAPHSGGGVRTATSISPCGAFGEMSSSPCIWPGLVSSPPCTAPSASGTVRLASGSSVTPVRVALSWRCCAALDALGSVMRVPPWSQFRAEIPELLHVKRAAGRLGARKPGQDARRAPLPRSVDAEAVRSGLPRRGPRLYRSAPRRTADGGGAGGGRRLFALSFLAALHRAFRRERDGLCAELPAPGR